MGKVGVLLNVGLILIFFGGCPLFYIYMVANVVPPHLEASHDWWSVLNKMFNSDTGWASVLSSIVVGLGCILFLWGLITLIGERRRSKTAGAISSASSGG